MTPEELLSLIHRKGYEARLRKDEVTVASCWFCGNDKYNLELNPVKGVYSCWACGTSGRLDGLLNEHLGTVDIHIPVTFDGTRDTPPVSVLADIPIASIYSSSEAIAYLNRRRIPLRDAARFELGICESHVYEGVQLLGRIAIPLRDYFSRETSALVIRGMYLHHRPKYMTVRRPENLAGYYDPRRHLHVLVEGPFDAMRVFQAGANAAALLGTGGQDEAIAWASRLDRAHPVLVLFDGDAQEKARRFRTLLEQVHPLVQHLKLPPQLDPADLSPGALGEAMRFFVTQDLDAGFMLPNTNP